MSIQDDIGIFNCFACHESGNVFNYVMLKENYSFREALHMLADRYGVEKQLGVNRNAPPQPPQPAAVPDLRVRLLEVLEAAAAQYESALRQRSAKACAEMLRKRGIRAPTASLFRLGFAPSFPADYLSRTLLQQNFTAEELIDAGVSLRRHSDGSLFDRFGGRLIIPILSSAGKVVGFGGRLIEDGKGGESGDMGRSRDRGAPKYLNSKESAVFRKSETLYALSMARGAARRKNEIVIVEGYMDAISLHAAGFSNVVACMGTSLNEAQLEAAAMTSPARRVVLALDADEAGQSVVQRLAQRGVLQRLESRSAIDVAVARLPPECKDPDDVIRRIGPHAFEYALSEAEDWVLYLGRQAISNYFNVRREAVTATIRAAKIGALDRTTGATETDVGVSYVDDAAEAPVEAESSSSSLDGGGESSPLAVAAGSVAYVAGVEPPSVTRAFSAAVSELSTLLATMPDGARKLRHMRALALTLADGDRPMAEKLELILERPVGMSGAPSSMSSWSSGNSNGQMGVPLLRRVGLPPLLPASVPADMPISQLFVWAASANGPSGTPPSVLHWDSSTCGAPSIRTPTLGELGSLSPCPICSARALARASSDAYSERIAAPSHFSQLTSERARAEVLALHALLLDPALRKATCTTSTPGSGSSPPIGTASAAPPFGIPWSTPARQWLASQLASPSRPKGQTISTVWAEIQALHPTIFEALPELKELYEPSQALVDTAAEWAVRGVNTRMDDTAGESSASRAGAVASWEKRPSTAALLARCRALIQIDEMATHLRARAKRLEWMGARAVARMHPTPLGAKHAVVHDDNVEDKVHNEAINSEGDALGFLAEDCVRMSAAVAADAAAMAEAASQLRKDARATPEDER